MILNLLVPFLAGPLLLAAPTPPLADVFVDINAPGCATGTGSAANPVCSIGAAIGIASPGDTIRIAPGTYVENVTIGIDLSLVGTGGADVTIVDGNRIASVITIPAAVTVDIEGLTVTNGEATPFSRQGGGINFSGALTLRNSTVSDNYAFRGGGLASNDASSTPSLVVEDSLITRNYALSYATGNSYGGGIYQRGGSMTITSTTISNNISATGNYYVAFPFLDTNNSRGGGVEARQVDVSITGSAFTGNEVYAYYGFGNARGAGLSTVGSNLVTISNSTFSGNSGGQGAGAHINCRPGSSLTNATITNNYGSDFQHGARVETGGLVTSSNLSIRNTIIAGNTSRNFGWTTDIWGSINTAGHNVFGITYPIFVGHPTDFVGKLATPVDALLGPLRDNGGPTLTHAPLLGSPAIDGSDPLVFEATDQRGIARPQGLLPDIGAFESDSTAPNLCNGDGGVVGCAQCPCGNNAPLGTVGGCLNSLGTSARIGATGSPSVSLPPMSTTDLRLTVTGATAASLSVMYSGSAVAPGGMQNPCFGMQTGVQSNLFDSLRCAVMSLRRHGSRPTDSNGDVGITNNAWGGSNAPIVGLAAQRGFIAGQTRYFQALYRENALLGCMRGLNTTQAVQVTFTP